jgi:TPR repeat protein
MYAEGHGVAQDDRQAVSWYRKAAEQGGRGRAISNLGWMYEEGRGVAQDDRQAVSWFRKGCRAGGF